MNCMRPRAVERRFRRVGRSGFPARPGGVSRVASMPSAGDRAVEGGDRHAADAGDILGRHGRDGDRLPWRLRLRPRRAVSRSRTRDGRGSRDAGRVSQGGSCCPGRDPPWGHGSPGPCRRARPQAWGASRRSQRCRRHDEGTRKLAAPRGRGARGGETAWGRAPWRGVGGERERRCRRESARWVSLYRYGFGYGSLDGPGGGVRRGGTGNSREVQRASPLDIQIAGAGPKCIDARGATPHPSAAGGATPGCGQASVGEERECRTSPVVGTGHQRRGAGRPGFAQTAQPGGIPRTEGGALSTRPEAGASLRVIRPRPGFVEPDEVVFRANAQRVQGPLQHPRPHRFRGMGGYPHGDRGRSPIRDRAGYHHRLVGMTHTSTPTRWTRGATSPTTSASATAAGAAAGGGGGEHVTGKWIGLPVGGNIGPLLLANLHGEGGRLRRACRTTMPAS